ncbi:phenylacetate-CoA oxygenase subunit PaaC [Nostoc ellipsosporum NOK]|nr:phenylacetate-CoA oxygenase subunit PaaC [Nostoc ellipsosporum NOK]
MSQLIDYTCYLADNALILGHRNSEWCGHGPVLEQDIAITNISLDLIGQARNFYQYAASLQGGDTTEDTLAYHRDANAFKNVLLVEQPRGDWAYTIMRQFLFSSWQHLLYSSLQHSADAQLAAIAAKALKEVTYHQRWSGEWVVRLGDGTQLSHEKVETALQTMWPLAAELFVPAAFEKISPAVDPSSLQQNWQTQVAEVFREAELILPPVVNGNSNGKDGQHTAELDILLKEMQYLPRTFPNATW